jgi:hypothetical protein
MPYIKQEKREQLELQINTLAAAIQNLNDPNNLEGTMNYIITSLINKAYPTISYKTINNVMGVLKCVGDEYYRRVAVPYENQKAYENSDVYPVYPNM